MKAIVLPITSLLLLAACHTSPPPQIVGGPCTYDYAEISATVVAVHPDSVELTEPDEGTFFLDLEQFAALPAAGETITIGKQFITQGSCTPVMYHPY